MEQVAFPINIIIGPMGAEGFTSNVIEDLVRAMNLACFHAALLFRSIVDADLFVGCHVLVTTTLVTAAGIDILVTGLIHHDIRRVVLIKAFVFAGFEDVAFLFFCVVSIRGTGKVSISFTVTLALIEGTVRDTGFVVGADLVVCRLVLVATAKLTSKRMVFDGALASLVLHGIQSVVSIKLFVGATSENVALLFSFIVSPMGASCIHQFGFKVA